MEKRAVVYGMAMLLLILLVSFNEGKAGLTVPAVAGIEDTKWQLVEVSNDPVSPLAGEKRPYILLDSAQEKATGFAGCNNFFGSYEIDGVALKFGPIGSTRMSCPDLQLSLETECLERAGPDQRMGNQGRCAAFPGWWQRSRPVHERGQFRDYRHGLAVGTDALQ